MNFIFWITCLFGGGWALFFFISLLLSRSGSSQKKTQTEAPESQETSSFGVRKALKGCVFYVLLKMRVAPIGPCYLAFRKVLRMLKAQFLKSNVKYELPWTLVLGDRLSGKDEVLQYVGLNQPIRSGEANQEGLLSWHFFDQGLVINVDSQCLLSQGGQETSWDVLVRNLQYWRPRVPIDSVVLNISLEELLAMRAEDLESEAKKIAEPLCLLEEKIGMSLPLYLMITKVDILPGFQGLVELTEGDRKQMLGWSNPYDMDKRFTKDTVQEAVSSVQQQIYQWSLRAFVDTQKRQYRDDVMVFAERLAGITQPLQQYISALLKMGSYRDYFCVRNVTFSGRDERSGEVAFVDDVFSKKVFIERGVAQPIKRVYQSTNAIIGWLRTAIIGIALVWGPSLIYEHVRLRNTAHELQHLLTETAHFFYKRGVHEMTEDLLHVEGTQKHTENTLKLLDQSAKYALFSWAVPLSWLSSLEKNFDQYVFKLYDYIVARPMYRSFEKRTEAIVIDSLDNIEGQGSSLSMEGTEAFRSVNRFVQDLETLEDKVSLYNALPSTQNIHHFREVVSYLYNFHLTEEFITERSFLQDRVLKNAVYRPFFLKDYAQQSRERFSVLFNAFLLESFNPERLFDTPRALQDLLEQIDRVGIKSILEIYTLLEAIDKTLLLFKGDGAWLCCKKFVPSAAAESFLTTVKKTSFFGETLAKNCLESMEKVFERSVGFLESFGSVMTGHFFARSEETGFLMPSISLVALRKALILALKQGFMQPSSHETIVETVEDDQIIHWDKQLINKAYMLLQSFETFLEEDLQSFPAEIQETIKLIARQQLELNVEALLSRAQTFFKMPPARWLNRTEEISRAYADNLREVSGLFEKIIEGLESAGAHALFIKLRDVLFRQMYKHLNQLESLVKNGAFFYPQAQSLRWWNGSGHAMFEIYGADDRLEMRTVWGGHMKRFKEMMGLHVAPVLELLCSPYMQAESKKEKVIQRWVRVSEQLEAYEAGQESSLKMLENFVMEEGNKITFANHREFIHASVVEKKSSDLFIDVLLAVKRAIYVRCQHMTAEQATLEYTSLAKFFNTHIAGVYPFTHEVPVLSRLDSELNPDTLQEFYKKMSSLSVEKINSLVANKGFSKSMQEVQAFLKKMLKIKEFLANYFAPTKEGQPPSVQFSVEYRAQKDKDHLGDHILDWAIINGDKSISMQQGGVRGSWSFGDNLTVGIEFVPDSPLMPATNGKQPYLSVLGTRALFVLEGFWSWLRFMQLHQATEKQGKTGGQTLLSFNIPMMARTTGVISDAAQVFLKVIPVTVSGQSAWNFTIPEFPDHAPYFLADEYMTAS